LKWPLKGQEGEGRGEKKGGEEKERKRGGERCGKKAMCEHD